MYSIRMAQWFRIHPELPRSSVDHWWVFCFAYISQNINFLEPIGAFDSSLHISEEATNASIAVPWATVGACAIGSVLGWGKIKGLLEPNSTDMIYDTRSDQCGHFVLHGQ